MSNLKEYLLYTRVISQTPVGSLTLFAGENGLSQISYGSIPGPQAAQKEIQSLLDEATGQLEEYFDGRRRIFELPLDWNGFTPYREKVLRACFAIPYGMVLTYGQLAAQTGNPKAARAVGSFMASNPLPIVIPCHRVVGSDGGLRGYGGGSDGLPTKTWLLHLEGRTVANNRLI